MANQVFANDLEIACKAAEGASKACFPDVCFTPPSPPAGWIPVPYANTTFAKDTANASKTVFITNKPVMLKDHSYFKTSTGNEPAAGPKGIVTGTKKGKAYFRTWSMNVKVEGYNVTRHTDLMTHNHNPAAGNTVTWQYLDSASLKESCKSENKKIEKACDHSNDEKKDPKKKKQNWKQRKCQGLNYKPVSPRQLKADPPKRFEDMSKDLKGYVNDVNVEELVSDVVEDVAWEVGEKVAGFAAKQVVKKVPIIGWAYQAYTLADDIQEVAYLSQVSGAVKDEATRMGNQLKDLPSKADSILKKVDTVVNGGLSEEDAEALSGEIQREVADLQRSIATLNPCTRARKCTLVPYKEKNKATGKRVDKSAAKTSELGCCPGQTKHHLIPQTYLKNRPDSSQCAKYDGDAAPTICVEGTSHWAGSHKAAHKAMDEFSVDDIDANSNISYEDAREAAIKSVTEAFPLSLCSPECLRAQLDEYYKNDAGCGDASKLKFKKITSSDEQTKTTTKKTI